MERHISWKQALVAEELGGIDPLDLQSGEEINLPYFDKGGHKARSEVHYPAHVRHFKKFGNVYKKP